MQGRYVNQHSFREPVGVGAIPFLDLGYKFYEDYGPALKPTHSQNPDDVILIEIDGCSDISLFSFAFDIVSKWFYIIGSFYCFFMATIAVLSYRRLPYNGLTAPRKYVLALDAAAMIANGFVAFTGNCKTVQILSAIYKLVHL